MPEYERKPLQQFAGYVGSVPEVRESRNGGEFTSFRLGVNRSYSEEDDEPTRWYSVAVNKPAVQEFVLDTIRKGMAVVVEGTATETRKADVVYHNVTAFRVGTVDWFVAGSGPQRREDEDL